MSMTELDWISECHENPMYAAGRIMEMQQRIAELEAALQVILRRSYKMSPLDNTWVQNVLAEVINEQE